MLFSERVLRGLVAGEIDLVFRRWTESRVRVGQRFRTAVGVVGVHEVTEVDAVCITEDEAARAGFRSAAALRASVDRHGRGGMYRLAVRYEGPDPRVELREQAVLDARERARIDRRLARLDVASPRGPWTKRLLELLRERPGVRAAELADGRPVGRFKSDVWKLKELGLTESLAVGYRLSPRGQAYLDGA